MKILIFSDSHGMIRFMQAAVEAERPDYAIHLGDCVRDVDALRQVCPMLPIAQVRGNCDYGEYDVPEQRSLEYDGVRVFLCHGHRYGVKSGLLRLGYAAKENQADVALFGHTHCSFCEEYDGTWLLNPGSCGYGAKPTCGVLEIQNKNVTCRIVTIEE